MKQNDVKKKLALLKQQGIGLLITDVIKYADTLLLDADPATDEEYGVIALQVMDALKQQYKDQLTIKCSKIIQIDIETAIEQAKEEMRKDKPFWDEKSKLYEKYGKE